MSFNRANRNYAGGYNNEPISYQDYLRMGMGTHDQAPLPREWTRHSDDVFLYQNMRNLNNKQDYWQTTPSHKDLYYSDRHKPYDLINRGENKYYHGLPMEHPAGITLLDSDSMRGAKPPRHSIKLANNYPIYENGAWPSDTFTDTTMPPTTNMNRWIDNSIDYETTYKKNYTQNGGSRVRTQTYLKSDGEIHPGYLFQPIPKPDNIPDYIHWDDMNSDSRLPLLSRTGSYGNRIMYEE